jgi:hypothetical protein
MKIENLFDAAYERASMVTPGGRLADIDRVVKNVYGLERPVKNSKCLSDQVFNLIESACESSYSFIKPSSQKLDPVNDYVQEQFGSTSLYDKGTHPMDAAYEFLESSVKTITKDIKSPIKGDEINNFANQLGKLNRYEDSKHSVKEVKNLIENIYKTKLKGCKSSLQRDPVNELLENTVLSGTFACDPLHSLNEWNALITKALGHDRVFSVSGSVPDIVEDFAADQFGHERPTSKVLRQVQDKIMKATYEFAYKLTPGNEEYNNKAKEIELLKSQENKLQNNLKEIDDVLIARASLKHTSGLDEVNNYIKDTGIIASSKNKPTVLSSNATDDVNNYASKMLGFDQPKMEEKPDQSSYKEKKNIVQLGVGFLNSIPNRIRTIRSYRLPSIAMIDEINSFYSDDKVRRATYELSQMTPGSEEYNKKAEEIDILKEQGES